MSKNKIKLLFITGSGRCGSTILHDILGQIDGFSAIGELRYVWERGLTNNSICGCQIPFRKCEFWQSVMLEAFGGMEDIDIQEISRLNNSMRIYNLPLMVIPYMRKRIESRLKLFLFTLGKLYRAIHVTSNSKVIIDSSKDPQYGYLLGMLPEIELYILHLIRDSRAVAYSWSRRKLFYPDVTSRDYMDRYNSIRSSFQWNARNIIAESCLRRGFVPYMRLRYEDLIEKPQESIKCILNMLGEKTVDLSFIKQNSVRINKASHSVFGNPGRFRIGIVKLKLDNEWKAKMRILNEISVMAITWPLLLKYRYLTLI